MKKRIFISFAVEDKVLRDFLVGQARNDNSPFEFYDMSVKTPWDHAWKTNCRTKIKGCDGVIAIITSNTKNANEYIVASIGLTKTSVCDLNLQLSLTGFGYTIKRVNVIAANEATENDNAV